MAEQKNVLLEHLYHKPLINPDELYNELMEYKKMVEPYVANVSLFLHEALKEGKTILLEGQLGSMKDQMCIRDRAGEDHNSSREPEIPHQ